MAGAVVAQENIRGIRRNLDLSQQELAALSGISREHISRLEHGRCEATLETLKRITTAFVQHIDSLIEAANE